MFPAQSENSKISQPHQLTIHNLSENSHHISITGTRLFTIIRECEINRHADHIHDIRCSTLNMAFHRIHALPIPTSEMIRPTRNLGRLSRRPSRTSCKTKETVPTHRTSVDPSDQKSERAHAKQFPKQSCRGAKPMLNAMLHQTGCRDQTPSRLAIILRCSRNFP